MKARIRKDGEFWIGEVYGTWSMMFGLYEREGWGRVTERCFTSWGAKYQLYKWEKERGKVFELGGKREK